MTTREIQPHSGQLSGLVNGWSEMRCPAVKQQEARARLAVMQRRGEIRSARAYTDRDTGEYVVEYVRLREPRSKAPLYVAAVTVPLAAIAGIGIMLWHARYVILQGVLGVTIAVLLMAAAGRLAGHRPTCVGLHCPGCRG